jgi:hypothetical protein
MYYPQQADVSRQVIYEDKTDGSSRCGSVTVITDASEKVIVGETVRSSSAVLASATIPLTDQPTRRKYRVIKGGRKLSLLRDSEHEPRFHAVEEETSVSLPRTGFTKLKKR